MRNGLVVMVFMAALLWACDSPVTGTDPLSGEGRVVIGGSEYKLSSLYVSGVESSRYWGRIVIVSLLGDGIQVKDTGNYEGSGAKVTFFIPVPTGEGITGDVEIGDRDLDGVVEMAYAAPDYVSETNTMTRRFRSDEQGMLSVSRTGDQYEIRFEFLCMDGTWVQGGFVGSPTFDGRKI